MRLHILILSLFLGAMALAGVGCSSSGSSGGASGVASAIDGTWSTSCQTLSGGNGVPGATTQKEVLVLSLGSFSDTQTGYSDGACSVPIATLVQSGTFAVSTTTTTVSATTVTEWTLVQSSIVVTPLTAPEANTLNTAGSGGTPVCTGLSFTNGTGTSIAGATCGGSSAMPTNGATLYDVYSLTGSTLVLGSSGNANLGQTAGYPSSMGTTYTN